MDVPCKCSHPEDDHGQPGDFGEWACSICHCPAFRPQMTPLPTTTTNP